jgi:mitochondrial import inner membrane translocase subunit TIM54
MAEPAQQDAPKTGNSSEVPKVNAEAAAKPLPKPPPKQNPVFRMMGLPNFRFRLPSRNWMIFLTIAGSWTAAITYDRRQKKAVQKKWADLVADISQEPLSVTQMRRKLTIFLSAPPGDGIRPSREYFKEYVKPVLVAAALDYDVIEGRKEGDVRYGTAEQIRRLRRKLGEQGLPPVESTAEEEPDMEKELDKIRAKLNITMEPGIRGDLVIGRHTWKEYVRGLHEGWLGPLDEPKEPEPEVQVDPMPTPMDPATSTVSGGEKAEEELKAETKEEEEKKKEEKKKEEKKKPYPPPSYLPLSNYSSAPLSPHTPSIFEPSAPIHQQHLLGFLKTPIRIYNYLNKRQLADQVGRETAALVLASHRPYFSGETFASTSNVDLDSDRLATKMPENDAEAVQTSATFEQQTLLQDEEPYWHKSVRKPKKVDPAAEKIWMGEVVLDPRIASRMRKFELDPDEEARARRIGNGEEKGRAIPPPDESEKKVVIGNLENEDA